MSCSKPSPFNVSSLKATHKTITLCSEDPFSKYFLNPFDCDTHQKLVAFSQGVTLETGKIVYAGRKDLNSHTNLYLWDRGDILKELDLSQEIISLYTSGYEVLVLLQFEAILLSDSLEILKKFSTGENSFGVACMTQDTISIPDISPGTVALYKIHNSHSLIVNAHNHRIKALALSPKGTLLASASVNGTLVRVFRTDKGLCTKQLRIGVMESEVEYIAMSHDDKWLAAWCSNGMLYVFDLEGSPRYFSFFSSYLFSCIIPKVQQIIFCQKNALQVVTSSECISYEIRKDALECVSRNSLLDLSEEWVLMEE